MLYPASYITILDNIATDEEDTWGKRNVVLHKDTVYGASKQRGILLKMAAERKFMLRISKT